MAAQVWTGNKFFCSVYRFYSASNLARLNIPGGFIASAAHTIIVGGEKACFLGKLQRSIAESFPESSNSWSMQEASWEL